MKGIKIVIVLLAVLLSACQFFLGPEADTSPEGVLYSLWKDFNEIHAYINIRIDNNAKFENWEEVYTYYKNELSEGKLNLFDACGDMLWELGDPHVNLYATGGNISTFDNTMYTYKRGSTYSAEREEFISIMRSCLKDDGIVTYNNMFLYGVFNSSPHTGYLYIPRFADSEDPTGSFTWVETIDNIVKFFRENTSALIVDVRYNTGGMSPVMEYIASRFAAVPTNYLMTSPKNGPGRDDFSAPMIYRVIPAGTPYTKPIALLTNRAALSAAEWFTLAMRNQPHVTHVGLTTCGALSIRSTHPMINGWYYSISAYKVTDINGNCYEGFGIRPQEEISGAELGEWTVHPGNQLEEVVKWLNK
jgi:C-terminal processing protease CtpA/Prc